MSEQEGFQVLSAIPMVQPRRVIARTNQSTEYKLRLTRVITEIDDFEEEIMVLESSTENDIVFLQISSPGGSLETCDFLCRRMQECEAPIVAEIGITCASAASALCLQASDWIVHDSSTMMIHACSYSPGFGKEVDVFASATYTNRINREWLERTYKGFLSEEEMQTVLDGKDLYFYADDLRERLPKYKEYRQETQVCDCPECQSLEEGDESLDLMAIIEQNVAEGVEKALGNILKKYDLVEKPKPVRKSRKKVVDTEVEGE